MLSKMMSATFMVALLAVESVRNPHISPGSANPQVRAGAWAGNAVVRPGRVHRGRAVPPFHGAGRPAFRGTSRSRSVDDRLRLLAHVLLQVVEGTAGFSGRSRSFPSAERLVSGPRAGGRPLRAIAVGHTGLDVLEKPVGLVPGAVEARGKAEVERVGDLHRLLQACDRREQRERQKQLLLPQRMTERK